MLAFLCLLIPMMPSYLVLAGPLKSNGSPAKMIGFAFFGLAILSFALIGRSARTRTLRPGVVVMVMYFLLMLLVYGVGLSRLGSAIAEPNKSRALMIVIANVGVALYALTRVEDFRQRNVLLGCLAIGLTFNCVVGILQARSSIDLHLLFQPPGFTDNQTDQGRGLAAALTDRFGAKRAFGTSGHAIEFTVLAAITLPLTIHFARYAADKQVRVLAGLAACVALLAMAAGVSRSGVIALTAALLVYVWTFTVRGLGLAATAGALAVMGGFAAAPANFQALWKTITHSTEDDSVSGRIAGYIKVSQTLRDHPVFGLGLGANPAREYGWLDNEWMQALAQGGGVGFLAMAALAAGGILGISAALRGATTSRERDQAYTMGSMFVGILASSYTFDLFAFQQASLLFFILFGLLWSNFTIALPEAGIMRAVVTDHASPGSRV